MEENTKKITLGKLISGSICLLAAALCIFVLIMSIVDSDGDISDIIWNEKAVEALTDNPGSFTVEYYKAYEDHYFTEDGFFSVSKIRYMPTVKQWQMTIRYNKSTLERLSEDLEREIDRENDVFAFALKDNEGKLYTDFEYKKTVKGRYTYYRVIFDDISVRTLEELNICIWFSEDIKDGVYPDSPLGVLPMYNSQMPLNEYKYKKELPENNEPAKGLLPGKQLLK
ncbi:MAG: hypothetical protein E7591_02285 [Ruminococcaceae bacterium]|nr:hypothetical protein [Oscillospiraceae bacterium]